VVRTRRTSDSGRPPPFLPALVDRTLTTRVVSQSAVTSSGSHRDPAASAPWRRVGVILGVAVHSVVGTVALPAELVSLLLVERLQKPFVEKCCMGVPTSSCGGPPLRLLKVS